MPRKRTGTYFLIFLLLLLSHNIFSQQQIHAFTLEDAIARGKEYSLDAANAKQDFRASYWDYRSYKGSVLPRLEARSTIPVYNRSYISQNYNGFLSYVPTQYAEVSGNVNLSQNIGLTGGNISLYSSLVRTDNFVKDSISRSSTSWYSVPISLTYTQPLFKFNQFKWDRKLKPLEYTQAQRTFLETIENVNIKSVNTFFNLLKAQIQLKIAQRNLSINDTLNKIAKGRYEVGKITETDKLQIEMMLIQAEARVELEKINLDNAKFQFCSFFRVSNNDSIMLSKPEEIEFFMVDPIKAIQEANKNSSRPLNLKRQRIQAAMDVNYAKMSQRFDADLSATIGYNNSTNVTFNDVYKNPKDNEQFALNLTIPILDWGEARGKIKKAQSKEEIIRHQVEQDSLDFDSEIRLKVAQFNTLKKQLEIASRQLVIARKSHEIAVGRYKVGKDISPIDLSKLQNDADNAETGYYSTLQTYWNSYFELERLTLFNFLSSEPIPFNFEEVKP